MENETLPPDQRAFMEQVNGARFLEGVARGDWRLARPVEWPYALMAIAADPRDEAPAEFFVRFDLRGYPRAPTGTPWDFERDCVLADADRPKGGNTGMVFRTNWQNGTALYAPFDRVAIEAHDAGWANRYPATKWDESRDFAFILTRLSELLHAPDYTGT